MLVKLIKGRKAYYYDDLLFQTREAEIRASLERNTYACRRMANIILDLDENKFEKYRGSLEDLIDSLNNTSAKAPQG